MNAICIAVLFLAQVTGLVSYPSGKEVQEKAGIRGMVTDLWGIPLGEATIKLFAFTPFQTNQAKSTSEISLVQSALSDGKGNFVMNNIVPGAYVLSVDLRGFRHLDIYSVYLAPGHNIVNVGLEVGANWDTPSITMSGAVRSAVNSPVQDAFVKAVSAFNPQIYSQTRTDKEGHYELRLPAAGQYVIYAFKEGFQVNTKTTTTHQTKNQDIVINRL